MELSGQELLRRLDEIAGEGSRKEKERLLADLIDHEAGAFIIEWAYNPFITYGVKPPRHGSSDDTNIPFKPVLLKKLLQRLSKRELTGRAADAEIAEVMSALDEPGAELLWRILSKDLKCGIAAATINAVKPGFIPTFSVMRAQKFEAKRVKKWPVIVEPKLDGYRYTFLCRNGQGAFFSRSGIAQPSAAHLVEPMIETALNAYQDSVAAGTELWKLLSGDGTDARSSMAFMVDGEMIVDGSFEHTGALRRQSEQAEGAVFHIFDIMSFADFDAVGSVEKTYLERRALVEEFVKQAKPGTPIKKTPRYYANSFEEIDRLYEAFLTRGLEGAMVKIPDGFYDKRKSMGWLKIKPDDTEDLPIVGAYPGEPGTKYEHCMGGAIVRRANDVEVRVGGGWSDEERERLWKEFQADQARLAGHEDAQPHEYHALGCTFLGRLSEVEFQEETPDGSLRHPRHKRFRDDKAGEVEKAA